MSLRVRPLIIDPAIYTNLRRCKYYIIKNNTRLIVSDCFNTLYRVKDIVSLNHHLVSESCTKLKF